MRAKLRPMIAVLLTSAAVGMPLAADEPVPAVLLREYESIGHLEYWLALDEILPFGEQVLLRGRTNLEPPDGSVLWSAGEIVLRAVDLEVLDHPLADQGVEVGVDNFRSGWGVDTSGAFTFRGDLRCSDASLSGADGVLRWAGTDVCTYLFSSADEMLLGDDLVVPDLLGAAVADRRCRVHALVAERGGLSPDYGLIVSTDSEPPEHVQGVLLPDGDMLDEHGAFVGTVSECRDLLGLLAWTGEALTRTSVGVPGVGVKDHIALGNRSLKSAAELLEGMEVVAITGASMGESRLLLFKGILERTGDVNAENDEFVALDDAILAREGDICPFLDPWEYASSAALLATDDYGNAAFVTFLRYEGHTQNALLYNGELLLKSGDLIDGNGDGVIDDEDHGSYFDSAAGNQQLLLQGDAAYLICDAVLPQFGRREVLLRIAPLPDIPNAWDTRPPCVGDVDNDRDVDQSDLGLLLAAYESSYADAAYHPCADLDADGDVDQADLGLLLPNYETACD